MPALACCRQGRAFVTAMSMDSGRLSMSAIATAGCPSAAHCAAQRPSGAMVPAGATAPCCAAMAKLIHRLLTAAWACACVAKAAASPGRPGPAVEKSTPSTPRRSYSTKTSGKWTSMPSAHPKRRPSTSKVTGPTPGVYMNDSLVFDSRRSS